MISLSNKFAISTLCRFSLVVTVVCVCLMSVPRIVSAEEEEEETHSGKGFYLGMRFIGSSLHVDEADLGEFFVKDDGGGIQFQLGYRFTRVFALELSAGGAAHDTSEPRISANIGFAQIFAIYRFAPAKAFRPYIKGGFGGYGLELAENDVSATVDGGGVAFGGGFDYFFSPHFALGVDFTHNIIEYNKATVNIGEASFGTQIDKEGALSTLGLSLAYYF